MRKKLLSLLLAVCMTLSLLPGTAYAAVGDLLSNSAQENQALLETLENLTGQDSETVRALLEQYGLLDEDGNLVTDKTVELDGVEYTLDEIEAILNDPATDLSQVGYVDGVPIALGDLKPILAIERELQRIQETYSSGAAFAVSSREPPAESFSSRSSGVSHTTNRPLRMMRTRSHTARISERIWELRITVWSFARCRMRSRISTTCLGSRPTVGSSRMIILGKPRMAWARPTRWR